jgi:hypothetical protein
VAFFVYLKPDLNEPLVEEEHFIDFIVLFEQNSLAALLTGLQNGENLLHEFSEMEVTPRKHRRLIRVFWIGK